MGSSCCGMSDSESDDREPLDVGQQSPNIQSSSPAISQVRPTPGSQAVPQNTNPSGRRGRSVTLFQPTVASLQYTSTTTGAQGLERLRMAQRERIIDQLPSGLYEDCPKKFYTECPICIIDFEADHEVKNLPCMHLFHKDCIDDWLMRNLRCPSCMEPVDAALVSQFDRFASI